MIDNNTYRLARDNPVNIRVMLEVARLYRGELADEVIEDRMQDALIGCLKTYAGGYSQKFTTSLHRHITWGLNVAVRGERRRRRRVATWRANLDPSRWDESYIPEAFTSRADDLSHIRERMAGLSQEDVMLITQYYFKGLSFRQIGRANGILKDAARTAVMRAVGRLRALCMPGVGV